MVVAKKHSDDLIPISEAAELLMLTTERIRGLAKEGFIDKPARGVVSRTSAVQGYIKFLKDEERRTSKSAAASAVQAARAKEIELRIARETGELVLRDDVAAFLADHLSIFRSELAGIPAAMTRDMSMREKFESGLNAAIARLADAFTKYRSVERLGIGADDVDDKTPKS